MINRLWYYMIVIAVAFAATGGRLELLTDEIFVSLQYSIELGIGLLGGMMLWCGVLKVAERSGLVDNISTLIRPVMRMLFRGIPSKSAAMGAMIMNITSNMLGLGNAATPMGLKAMQELQELNPKKDTATDAMCLFLVVNAAPIQLLPATVLSLRVSAGSANPGIIILPTIISSFAAVSVGVTACKLLERARGGGR
ncbi:MAG TPA: nucleoside recognition domain-containing protein [Bacillota bacterium]|nr:nucleoside recognition domain-containing protein [Bacillota bacterium]HPL52702.1 nucleoside recognition domain-containing protein [Bacillota bacterium]